MPPNPRKPVLFVALVFGLLLLYSFLADKIPFVRNKRNNFIADISAKEKAFAKNKTPQAVFYSTDSNKNLAAVRDYLTYDGIISYEAERKFALTKFIGALKDLKAGKRKKVRVAYFGDSIIEGDLISQDLRRLLQDSFGGNGVGFVPVTSVVSGFRETINHSFGTWTDKSFVTSPGAAVFLSGHTFLSDSSSTVQYGVVNLPHLQRFSQAYVLYGKGQKPLSVTVNAKPFTLPATKLCNKVLVAENCSVVRIKAVNATPLFGLSFEDSTGVFVDNFAFRGSSGLELQNFGAAFLKQIQQVHDYDLLIFQYGPNLFKPDIDDFTWYEKPLLAGVQKFKAAFPAASLLIISTADKAYRYNGQMETAVGVEPLLTAQNNVAAASGINLWNLYRAMGGYNSMLTWVEGDTALARKDYTHFTGRGALKIGTLLFNAILKEYAPDK